MIRNIIPILALSLTLGSSARADLIGYWNLEGNFDDTSAGGNNGTLFGGATYEADAPAGITGTMSVAFDGLEGTYGIINPDTGGMAITTLPDFTVSMWVKGDGTLNSDDRVFSESMSTDENPLFNVGTHNASTDGTVDIFVRNGGAATTFGHAHSPGIAFDDTWHHLVFVGGADSLLDVYIDGVFDQQFDHSIAPAFTPDTTTFGGILRAADCCNFLGSLDDIAVWNQELLPVDIASLAAGTVSPADLEPTPIDSDMDGMRDDFEQLIIDAVPDDAIATLADVLPTDDFDSDGSTNENEATVGTDPINPDTDGDGANDGSETNTGIWASVTDRGTDPFNGDTDGDDLSDGVENPDLPFVDANQTGTDPNKLDSDGDEIPDGAEVTNGTDPTDSEDPGPLPRFAIDFNSTSQDGGPHPVGTPYQDYDAGHEVPADFIRQTYTAFNTTVGVMPSWPDTPDQPNTMQMIDRGGGNDDRWLGTQVDLLTDWLGVDTRTANGGLGDYDGVTGTPTPMLLTLDGIPGGTYSWTSYHHDTENIHTPFTLEFSTDGGTIFEDVGSFQMSSSSPNGNPVNPAVETEGTPGSLTSTVRHDFTTDGTGNVVLRFVPLSQVAVHQQVFGINGFDLVQTSSNFSKFAITDLQFDSDTETITITWPSIEGQVFSIDTSADLQAWTGDLEDGLPAVVGAEETSYSFPLSRFDTGGIPASKYFVRVRIIPN